MVSPVLLLFIVNSRVTTLSQPAALVKVCIGVDEAVKSVPYQVKLSQAVAIVSPIVFWFIVNAKVTTLSHSAALVKVYVGVTVLEVYVCPSIQV